MDKIELLRQLTAAHPENAQTWYLLGMEYAEAGDIALALSAYAEALQHGADDLKPSIAAALAQLSARAGSDGAGTGAGSASGSETARASGDSSESGDERDRRQPLTVGSMSADADANHGPDYGAKDRARTPGMGLRVLQGGVTELRRPVEPNRVTFADVGGLEDVKRSIDMKIIQPFTTPGLFTKFKKKVGGGILLYGPPGCGKTFIARATAGECGASFVSVHISDILGKYVGESEENLHAVFTTARAQRPSVLFFDEIDTLGYSRAKSTSQPMRGVIDQLLMEMEGATTDMDRILLIGSTNTPWDVDPAFKRPGRFDKLIFVAPPDLPARAHIFRLKLDGRPLGRIDVDALARQTDLYSGADIENVVEVATERVINGILESGVERPIEMRDLEAAIADTKPSTVNWLRTVKNYVKYANQDGQYNDVEAFLRKYRSL